MSVGQLPPPNPAYTPGLQLLGVYSASAGASIDVVSRNQGGLTGPIFQSDFDEYEFEAINIVPATDNTDLRFRVSLDGGATFVSSNDYHWSRFGFDSGGSSVAGATNVAFIRLAAGIDNDVSFGLSGNWRLVGPLTSVKKKIYGHGHYLDNSPLIGVETGNGTYNQATAVNACQFFMSSGNLTGTILVYGKAKSAVVASPLGGAVVNAVCNGRLTTETLVPVSTSDRTAQSTLYFTPYMGNQIGLYTGSGWAVIPFNELSLALTGLTSGKNYDVFVNLSGGPVLTLSVAWASDTARTDAIVLQDGIYVKSGATTQRWVGTIRTTSTTTTEDSLAKRFVWNAYNQVRKIMRVVEATDTWSYITATCRQANANAANQLDYVTGDVATSVDAQIYVLAAPASGAFAQIGIGVDTTSAFTAGGLFNQFQYNTAASTTSVQYSGYPGLGRHFLSWNERGGGSGTMTWYGDGGSPTTIQSGIVGSLWG